MIKKLLAYVKEYRASSIMTPVMMIGEVLCEMIIPVLMGRIVDQGVYGGDMTYIVHTGLIMVVVAIIGLGFGIGGGVFGAKASAGFAKNLRKAEYDQIQTFSFANIDRFSPSSLVTRLTTDITNIQNAYMMSLRMAIRAPMSMIIAMIMSFLIDARLASVYLVAVIFLGIVLFFVMNTAGKYFQKVFDKYDELNESVQENVSAIRVVKAYVREDHEISKFTKAAANIYLMFVSAEKKIVGIMPLMQGVVYACILLISWFGAHFIIDETLTTGSLMSLLTYCMNILMSLMMLAMVFVMITMSNASAKRILMRYFLAELAFAALTVGCLLRFDISVLCLRNWGFLCCLFLLSLVDLEIREIPDGSLIAAAVIWLAALPFLWAGWADALLHLAAGLVYAGVLLGVSLLMDRILGKESLGGGDVKLLAVIGLYLGFLPTLFAVILACVLGLLQALISGKRRGTAFPFGPALSAGAALMLFFGSAMMDWYLGLFL